jgi:hypothetical protein
VGEVEYCQDKHRNDDTRENWIKTQVSYLLASIGGDLEDFKAQCHVKLFLGHKRWA